MLAKLTANPALRLAVGCDGEGDPVPGSGGDPGQRDVRGIDTGGAVRSVRADRANRAARRADALTNSPLPFKEV